MKTRILYILSLMGFLSSCYDYNCPDEIQTPYTEENLKYFPFKTGDTTWYYDESRGKEYYLTCIKETLNTDSIVMPAAEYCSNETYLEVNQGKEYLFSSNIPHPTDDLAIKMWLSKAGENNWIDIFLGYANGSSYLYNFLYTSNDSLSNREADFSLVRYRDSVWINDEIYDNVYSICFSTRDDIRLHAYYDTIYYNHDGFLKFISSKYGYRLERLP
ncbi:MAG: hypothetical protein JW801_06295 [Bacteroidales bacterium]|nr:hypothetical protein [Bacteroidales bacterium]